jgi:hypothetical protein
MFGELNVENRRHEHVLTIEQGKAAGEAHAANEFLAGPVQVPAVALRAHRACSFSLYAEQRLDNSPTVNH